MTSPFTIDFGQTTGGQDWRVVNDGVMGGRSQGKAVLTENSLKFEGTVSLENNGGFASFRGPYGKMDLSQFSTVSIRYKSTGQRFALNLELHEAYYMPKYKAYLEPSGEDWKEVTFDLTSLEAYRLGKKMGSTISKEDLQRIIRIGFITSEKKEGPFAFEVDYVKFQ